MIRGNRVSGGFEVSFDPMSADDEVISRMRVTKKFTGGLTGLGSAEMLTVGTAIEGSAAYVAIECVDGVLDDRRGSFVLQHSGLMRRGAGSLVVTVVPDSGTDELLGLRGEFTIENAGAVHTYVFDYVLDLS
jgi:hypothetical protein